MIACYLGGKAADGIAAGGDNLCAAITVMADHTDAGIIELGAIGKM